MSLTVRQIYYRKNRDKMRAEARDRYWANHSYNVSRQKELRQKRLPQVREQALRYYRKRRSKSLVAMRKYRKLNRDKINNYTRRKMASDKSFLFSARMRRILHATLRGKYTDAVVEKNFGCGTLDLVDHIAAQFKPGMSWDNHGEWEIDHRIPCRAFDCADPEQRAACWHFTNMRPLWASENREKNCSIPNGFDARRHTRDFLAA